MSFGVAVLTSRAVSFSTLTFTNRFTSATVHSELIFLSHSVFAPPCSDPLKAAAPALIQLWSMAKRAAPGPDAASRFSAFRETVGIAEKHGPTCNRDTRSLWACPQVYAHNSSSSLAAKWLPRSSEAFYRIELFLTVFRLMLVGEVLPSPGRHSVRLKSGFCLTRAHSVLPLHFLRSL